MLPREIMAAPLRTVRPQDLAHLYTQPFRQLDKRVRRGEINKLARGVYYAPPDDVGLTWIPTMEAATAAVATAFFGARVPILMHLTAARLHGAVPRALAVGIVAVPRQQKPMQLTDRDHGQVIFVKRGVADLDAVLMSTELGQVLVTTPGQTALDLAKRPRLAGDPTQACDAIRQLFPRIDMEQVAQLAHEQRAQAALTELKDFGRNHRGGHVGA
jgi:hypothetical protein